MPPKYRPPKPAQKTHEQVMKRVGYLRAINEPYLPDRYRIRALMNGGQGALDVLLKGLPTNDDTLPAANLIRSGVERFSEMISPPPDLRIDPPAHTDKDEPRKRAEKRERIVASYDEKCELEKQLVQGSLWCPGYGFFSWRVGERIDANGYKYPHASLYDPYTTWPAEWGIDQKPADIAYQFFLSRDDLIERYPRAKAALEGSSGKRLSHGAVDLTPFASNRQTPGWDGVTGGFEVIIYVDAWGTYEISPQVDGFLAKPFEHPLSRAPIVVPRRFTFDTLVGQFNDVVGLASTMAKLTLLTQIVMEDAAFAPVVVNGRMDAPFRKGRDAVNIIEGGDAKYLYQNIPYQMFQEIDRIEGHFRSTTGYSKQADGESPISFVTGQGLEELGSSLTRQVERYQLSFSTALQDLDAIRLEWDETAYGDEERPLEGFRRGASFSETYRPSKDIDGSYRTRRVYGMMAGWDEPTKIVGGLQLLSADVIDKTTFQENLRGLDNVPQIEERSTKSKAQNVLFEGLMAAAQQGDPAAIQASLKVFRTGDLSAAIEEFYGPQEEAEVDPMAAGGAEPLPEAPPDIAQVLSRLTQGGEAQGGAQTIARTNQ